MDNEKVSNPRQRRHRFTINNPIVTDDVKILDRENLTDEQKELLNRNTPTDYSFIKDNEKFRDLFDFHLCEYDKKEDNTIVGKIVAERAFFKSYEHAQHFFASIDFINYVCFQMERGETGGNLHLQGFMNYDRAMYFQKVKAIFPPIHLDRCYKPSEHYRDYCMKNETKVEGFDFWENKAWQDDLIAPSLDGFIKDVNAMKSVTELKDNHGKLAFIHHKKIEPYQQDLLKEQFGHEKRNVHVTYIYGKEGTGKSSYWEYILKLDPKNVYEVGDYDYTGKFDGYTTQDVIVFDEYDSQIKLTQMNKWLDGRPYTYLTTRNIPKLALYTKVFVISNYSLDQLYQKERQQGKEPSYRGFLRRFNEIIYMPDWYTFVWIKGQPTAEVIEAIKEQNGKYTVKEQPVMQTTLEEVF
jgi:hypothetical protein